MTRRKDFRKARETLGMSAKDLAALFDVAPETVSRWENGYRNDVPLLAIAVIEELVLQKAFGMTRLHKRLTRR